MSCNHPQTEVRKRRFANGRYHLQAQCLACGELVGKFVAQEGISLDEVAGVDYALMEAKEQERRTAREQQAAQARLSRHLQYEEYLRNSPNWQRLRAAVLKRDRGVCQGCLSTAATEVHHTTYVHIYEELAYELVSVCRDCHERAHGLYVQPMEATV